MKNSYNLVLKKTDDLYTVEDLLAVVAALRAENGCPWDLVQTHASMREKLIEEAFEAADAMDKNDSELLREELGDVLFNVIMHIQMENEQDNFTLEEVVDEVTRKIVLRHPHVFAGKSVDDVEDVLTNWEKIKQHSKGHSPVDALKDIPKTLPALMRAQKLYKRAANADTHFSSHYSSLKNDLKTALDKLECLDQSEPNDPGYREGELLIGEALFALAAMARERGIPAESALSTACGQYIERFEARYTSSDKNN